MRNQENGPIEKVKKQKISGMFEEIVFRKKEKPVKNTSPRNGKNRR